MKFPPKDEIIMAEARYIIIYNATVRQTAKNFATSKSTVHNHVTKYLAEIDKDLFDEVKKVLQKNKAEHHFRGGMATKANSAR